MADPPNPKAGPWVRTLTAVGVAVGIAATIHSTIVVPLILAYAREEARAEVKAESNRMDQVHRGLVSRDSFESMLRELNGITARLERIEGILTR